MRFVAGASACLAAGAAHAEVTPALPLGAMLQSFFALLLVLAVIAAAAWLLRRAQRLPGASSAVLRSVSGIAVGPKERVIVVEIGETWLVLGVAPGQVRTLHTLPRQALPAGSTEAPRFAEWLARARGRNADHV